MTNILRMHHVTAITSSAEKIYEFFTYVLGMRLVKKTVNQDDINTYHLFFADDKGTAGTDMTFFDFKGAEKGQKSADEIHRTAFRVPSDKAIDYWSKRFEKYEVKNKGIEELFGKKIINFEDFDGQLYMLISDEKNKGVKSGIPWEKGPVPTEFAITGLGPITLKVTDAKYMDKTLTSLLNFTKTDEQGNFVLYEVGEGGNGASVLVLKTEEKIQAYQGYGDVHHVAFGVKDESDLIELERFFNQKGYVNSSVVDRFYFKSLYVRLYPFMLFEFATEGPGFIDDEEPYETLGEKLALPPKFRDKREYVESVVRHIDTTRSDKVFKKEYLWWKKTKYFTL